MTERGLQGSLLWRKTRYLFLPIVSITFLKTTGTLLIWQAGEKLYAAEHLFSSLLLIISETGLSWSFP